MKQRTIGQPVNYDDVVEVENYFFDVNGRPMMLRFAVQKGKHADSRTVLETVEKLEKESPKILDKDTEREFNKIKYEACIEELLGYK